MARLIAALLRHGEYRQPSDTPSANLLHPLNEWGEAQAAAGVGRVVDAARAAGCEIYPVIDSSSLLRAWQTASIVAGGLVDNGVAGVTVEEFDALRERGLGAAANLSMAEIDAVMDADPRYGPLPDGWKRDSFFRLPFPDAESLMEAGERVAKHLISRLSELSERIAADTLKVFVGHGGAFRHAAVHLGVLTAAEVPALSMAHCRPVLLERLDDATWKHAGGEWKRRGGEANIDW